jgi:hypothetical protein
VRRALNGQRCARRAAGCLQIGTARPENQAPVPLRHDACSLEDGRFTHAGSTFDDQDSATAGVNTDRRQFRFAFEKFDHTDNDCLRDS